MTINADRFTPVDSGVIPTGELQGRQRNEQSADVYGAKSGRVMEMRTDQPGLQFYTGKFLDGTLHGERGKVCGHRSVFCMETQHFPDSPNQPPFPTTELKPGQTDHTVTVYRFSAR